ncbi:MAG: hypothetical protein JWO03_855, partial [Bacteroidetes bacterium]|nr:hypothetical protein [Bacteroidota bacterium]
RSECNTAWVKADGTLWTFGGIDGGGMGFHDMWKFDIGTNNWIWMSGPQGGLTPASFGTMGVELASNLPPVRGTYTRWVDANDNFYIFGGYSQGNAVNDTWKYNTSNNRWTWVAGSSSPNNPGLYSSYCVPGAGATPPSRFENRTAQSNGCSNVFWTFGGFDQSESVFDDLWNFNAQTSQWTWVSGSNSLNNLGNYGTLGVGSASTTPPGKGGVCMWVDNAGTLWMWGGMGVPWNIYSDMWKFVADTACLHSSFFASPISAYLADSVLCTGDSAHLTISGGHILSVTPSATAHVLDSLHVVFYPATATSYAVAVSGSCGIVDTLHYHISTSQLKRVSVSRTICPRDSFVFGAITVHGPGIYRDTIHSITGCDSLLTLTVTASPPIVRNIAQSICPGGSTVFHGQVISTAGVYSDTLTSAGGCDSIVRLTVSVQSVIFTNISGNICPGGSITFGGHVISSPGTYQDTFSILSGCDSVVVLTVSASQPPVTNISQGICPGGSLSFHGQIITSPGVYRDTLPGPGCDSIVILTVTSPAIITQVTRVICFGGNTSFAGQVISSAGVYSDTLTAASGCDSIVVLAVAVLVRPVGNIAQTICNGDSVLFDGRTISTAGTYMDTLVTPAGCDSIVALTITLAPRPVAGFSIEPVGDSIPLGIISVINTSINTDSVFWLLNNQLITLLRDTVLPITASGDYCIRLIASSNAGCSDTTQQCIYVFENSFAMPNAFTPNGDGKNDLFYPVFVGQSNGLVREFKVYNRWGQQIYNDPTHGWDGKYNGEPQPGEAYTYFIVVNLPDSSSPGRMRDVKKEGSFVLLR